MKILNRSESQQWCVNRSIKIDSYQVNTTFRCTECIEIEFPVYPSRFVYLSWVLIDIFANEESSTFKGGLVGITQYGLDSYPVENLGLRTIEIFRSGNQKSSIEDYPCQLFGLEEKLDAAIALFNTMNFGWDSIWVPDSGDYFVFKSHDDIIYLLAKKKEDLSFFKTELQKLNFKVKLINTPSYLI